MTEVLRKFNCESLVRLTGGVPRMCFGVAGVAGRKCFFIVPVVVATPQKASPEHSCKSAQATPHWYILLMVHTAYVSRASSKPFFKAALSS